MEASTPLSPVIDVGDLVERGGVDRRALAATGGRHGDLDALRLADRLDGVVDDSVEVA